MSWHGRTKVQGTSGPLDILSTAAKITQQRWPVVQVVRDLAREREPGPANIDHYYSRRIPKSTVSSAPLPGWLAGRKPGPPLSHV